MEDTLKAQLKCPIALEWTIPENRLLKLKDKPGEFFISDIFNISAIPGVKYYLSIYPDEGEEESQRQTWIYFHLKFTNETKLIVQADFNIKIQSANFCSELNDVYDASRGFGSGCCSTDELFDSEKLFIVDGEMTIKIEGTLMVEKEMPIKSDLFDGHADTLGLELWKQENKDFAIIVDGKEITAHKSVLTARSPVFARMFETDMKESKENKALIEDFQFDIVEAAIKLCYHHSLVPVMTLEKKFQLLQFCDKYDIRALKVKLEEHLISEINPSNVCQITNASLVSNAQKLEKKCCEFLRECLKKTEAISDFDILHPDFAMNLLKNAFCKISK